VIEDWDTGLLRQYGRMCAHALARAHARSGDAALIAGSPDTVAAKMAQIEATALEQRVRHLVLVQPSVYGTDNSVPTYAQDNPSFIFPLQALLANVQGNPIVRVEVLADGKPGRMWLKQSSGSGILDRDAQSQLTFWRFNPAMKNGQPVAAWIDVPVVYRLQDAKK